LRAAAEAASGLEAAKQRLDRGSALQFAFDGAERAAFLS
jgi:hypothetical protein